MIALLYSNSPYYRRFRCVLYTVSLLFLASSTFAQRVNLNELLTYMSLPAAQFDQCMFRKGFVCYKNESGVIGFTCLFAYSSNTLLTRPTTASALIQYVRTGRSDILMYQVRSKEECDQLQQQLIRQGYALEPVSSDRLTYVNNNVIVTCQKVDVNNAISGNYAGYNLSFIRRWY
ncbi:hypothetical protein M0L20_00115 [Spirosoma sp. RP8]|uniref:Uncharacterized protein n=1 Tax=Spirosoma liriopis TaxID=2937440 RepID=A0ABT0HDI8_9BACT|nr:hypothetical protein [Spirosoma liriopis]MCK8490229.1 hypothetical protein [Spirosoma liriopis]